MEQSSEPIEQGEKKKLCEMPVEILVKILIHLDFESLLRASHVCQLFASVAETAFEKKNANIPFRINHCNDKKPKHFYMAVLNKYGDKMRKLDIDFDGLDDDVFHLLGAIWGNLKCCWLQDAPMLPPLNNLTEAIFDVSSNGVALNLSRQSFSEFISNNQQLEHLDLGIDVDLLDILDGRLDKLKSLSLSILSKSNTPIDLPKIRLNSLKTLQFSKVSYQASILRAMQCNENIREIWRYKYCKEKSEEDEVIDEICKFKALRTLEFWSLYEVIPSDQLEKLVKHLPDLTELRMSSGEDEPFPENVIRSVLEMFPKLTKLTIELETLEFFNQFLNEVKKSDSDFHARFAKRNTTVHFLSGGRRISITEDCLLSLSNDGIGIHWMNNFNEKNVRKVLAQKIVPNIYSSSWIKKLKLVNNDAGCAFDLATLAHHFSGVKCLDFKSNGPLSVSSDVSCDFFRLTVTLFD